MSPKCQGSWNQDAVFCFFVTSGMLRLWYLVPGPSDGNAPDMKRIQFRKMPGLWTPLVSGILSAFIRGATDDDEVGKLHTAGETQGSAVDIHAARLPRGTPLRLLIV